MPMLVLVVGGWRGRVLSCVLLFSVGTSVVFFHVQRMDAEDEADEDEVDEDRREDDVDDDRVDEGVSVSPFR